MKNILLVFLIVLCASAQAQRFQQRFSIDLSRTTEATPEWYDMDNDGLLDVVLLTKNDRGRAAMTIISGDTTVAIPQRDTTIQIGDFDAYTIADLDRDGQLDLLISNQDQTHSYLNKGKLAFEEESLFLPPFNLCRFADLNDDGMPDAILDTDSGLIICAANTSRSFSIQDTLDIDASDIAFLDANEDGTLDIFLSGRVNPDSVFTGILTTASTGSFFIPEKLTDQAGKTSIAHFNDDGFMDLLFSSPDPTNPLLTFFALEQGKWKKNNISLALTPWNAFPGDFNSDGFTDIAVRGITSSGDSLNLIRYADADYDTLPVRGVISQRFADFDHDGDLDVLQVVQQGSLQIHVLEHQSEIINRGPQKPSGAIGISIFDALLIYWEDGMDDHTAVDQLTYDVHVRLNQQTVQPVNFDLKNYNRLAAAHGNAGSMNFRFLKNLPGGNFDYGIQSIDNSYHAAAGSDGSGMCNGTSTVCLNVATEQHQMKACRTHPVKLTAPVPVLWFSFNNGYLGTASSITTHPQRTDTLFYFNPADRGCFGLKVFKIIVDPDTLTHLQPTVKACEGEMITLRTPTDQYANWSSLVKKSLGYSDVLQYEAFGADTVSAETNLNFCYQVYITPIQIIRPDIKVENEQLKIMIGSSVELNASGGLTYEWHPGQTLSDSTISNPIATPRETTRYTVTGFDDRGCFDEANVTVTVEETGFIPSLFTPNADGTNDVLKVYGLTGVNEISFIICDREGVTVFSTHNLFEAAQGWDGTRKGIQQPAGVYYWKVEGVLPTGKTLLLNGKASGSVVLVR